MTFGGEILIAAAGGWRRNAGRAVAVVGAAVGMCWPALVARSPVWIPDSVVYFLTGKQALRIFLRGGGGAPESLRSVVYSFGIYLLHRDVSAWPVVALNALLVAWTMWLVVRSIVRDRPAGVYLGLTALLCGASTVSWYVVLLTPDILGGVLSLCLYLLVFARESLRRWETAAVVGVVLWTATAHPTYPVLAAGLCCFLGVLGAMRWRPVRGRGLALGGAMALLVVAMLVQVGANKRVFGQATLMGPNPPRMMARIIADGTGRDYLQANCSHLNWTICLWVKWLPYYEDAFLWSPDSIYQVATPDQRKALEREQMPLVLRTLRAYPVRQVRRSGRNFATELADFGIPDTVFSNAWMMSLLDAAAPGASASFARAMPILDGLPRRALWYVQEAVGAASAVAVVWLLPWAWRRREERLLGLGAVVLFVLLANAFVTGVTAGYDSRYEGRIAWLMPMLAGLFLWEWRREAGSRK